MKYFFDYIVSFYIPLCVVIVLGITLFRKMKAHRRDSIYLLVILLLTLLITVCETLETVFQFEINSIFFTTFFASLLYLLRPGCILCFIFLSWPKIKSVWLCLLLVPFFLLLIVNLLAFFDGTKELVNHYLYKPEEDSLIHWQPGKYQILRYAPHIVAIFYLVVLVFTSIRLLQMKHIADALGILICAAVVSLASLIETFFDYDGTLHLLPSSMAVSTVFYYLFLYERSNKIDVLTGLFNRAAYFDDFAKLRKDITGIIQLDMNGLKYLNDNYGHLEGDKGLKRIAEAIANNTTRKMYAYRIGGDEFMVLAIGESEEKMMDFLSSFKKDLSGTNYYCSIGYACRNEESDDAEKMMKLSEQRMYLDKEEFYKTAGIERRKSGYIEKESN